MSLTCSSSSYPSENYKTKKLLLRKGYVSPFARFMYFFLQFHLFKCCSPVRTPSRNQNFWKTNVPRPVMECSCLLVTSGNKLHVTGTCNQHKTMEVTSPRRATIVALIAPGLWLFDSFHLWLWLFIAVFSPDLTRRPLFWLEKVAAMLQSD